MIIHIVMWKLKDFAEGASKKENALMIKAKLESLKDTVNVIKHIEVGINIVETDASADVALYSEFRCMDDLNAYQKHPEHQAVVQFVKNVCMERKVVDYER
ncbi:MAG: Dabb family protein [Candidatus Brocadiaceae bacterium]|nr:Dabb family protein [Candidatus Brocadiaceae bacterium]